MSFLSCSKCGYIQEGHMGPPITIYKGNALCKKCLDEELKHERQQT